MKRMKIAAHRPHQLLHGTLAVTIFREGKSYVAYSPALDLSTAGKTLSAAQENFDTAVRLFLDELIEHDTLDEVLSDLGWEKTARGYAPPPVVAHSEVDLDHATHHTHQLAHV